MGSFQYGKAWESRMILSPHADHGGWPALAGRGDPPADRNAAAAVVGGLWRRQHAAQPGATLPDGSIRPEEEAVLKGIAPWMQKYGRAIHRTRGGPWVNGSWGGSTHRGNRVFLHVFTPGDQPLRLRALQQLVVAAATIDGTDIPFAQAGGVVSLTIPAEARDPHVTVVELTLDQPVTGPLDGDALVDPIETDPPGTLVLAPAAARLQGGLQAQVREGVASIGYWGNREGTAEWDVGINSPGTYQVRLSLSNPRSGSKLKLEIAGQTLTVDVPNTGNHDVYRTVDAGRLTFPNAEQAVLRVSVADQATWRPANIRHVKLVPSNR
ncbi:MAG: DUF5010 C-terminal domain-containing protein [Kiritimatiellia bacterium]